MTSNELLFVAPETTAENEVRVSSGNMAFKIAAFSPMTPHEPVAMTPQARGAFTRMVLCIAAALSLIATAAAASVWTCSEDGRAGDPIPGHAGLFKLTISEGKVVQTDDPFSRSLGGPSGQWTIIRDTQIGLVAIDGEARVLPSKQHAVGASVLLLDYASGRYAENSFDIDRPSVTSHGSCLQN